MAAYGFNSVVPARGGDIIKLFLTKTSIPHSSYPAVGASFFVEAIFDLCMAIPILAFAFTPGRVPQAPGLLEAARGRPRLLRLQPALHAVPADRAGDPGARRLRVPVGARAGVLGARAAGPGDPARPPALLPRGLLRPARRVGVPLHGVLVPARGVQRRRLGAERPAGARRQRRRRARARSPPAAPGSSRRCWSRSSRAPSAAPRSPPTRSASRSRSPSSRSPSASPRSSSSSASAPSRRSSPPGARPAARRRRRPRPRRGPGAPRARASRPRGRPWPSRRGSAAPAGRSCPGR